MPRRQLLAAALGAGLLIAPFAGALAWEEEVQSLKQRWEQINTQQAEGQRRGALKSLAGEAEQLSENNEGEAQPLIWYGIIEASHARERSGLGALSSARSARAALERAIELDPQGGNGSAYVTLGALYDRAPGRPIGFGNSETAERMFQRALEIRPDGIDVNYYYAAFLEDEGRRDEAREHAQRAVDGTAREDRQGSDEALREEARALLSRL
ncbi:TRAP transporter TatT component family protein [Billgrantia lactosivorans]|uniref:TRAP transporter TatT component family protein n=1 Tax=Billgrantia lactosivorans TaxID=2185141 RepID=UPI000DAEB7E4|nr:TRAP transporter TatT component family protein [Halomonas lactosivorans]